MSVAVSVDYSGTRFIVIMGVTGCGKSTVGRLLADKCHCPFIEGDDYHSADSKKKMQAGIALTDEDRWPWLRRIVHAMTNHTGQVVVSCSSLKRSYRDTITQLAGEPVLFVYLHGSASSLTERLANRHGHFMSKDLLNSQLATLEVPTKDEHSFSVGIETTATDIVAQIRKEML